MKAVLKFVAAGALTVLVAVVSVSYSIGTNHVQSASAATSDYLLTLDGVGNIEVLSWSWGITSPRDHASGQASGKRQYQPVIIRKRIDKASPLLAKAIDNSTHYKQLVLTVPASNGGPSYTVTFTDVMVSSFQEQADGLTPPSEDVSFTFQKIEMK